ncbi:hypothetical protein SAMN05216360_103116 [Methylobacterium phyllostachyos]|uniref:Uncharacterized protein n=1 Tax=Methylobacterium phyllostachyos TaxID=582672 RepID=A0A1G9V9Z8_9HYPH|nr:hypothetical protein [Methylobacterium phyllostachyos]SDM68876.1 hypothetical protein SAMN05216360_103116 [Methylobacterium phyllostachyos]
MAEPTQAEKHEAACEALEKAADLLLEHAEGIAGLFFLAERRHLMPPEPLTITQPTGPVLMRNRPAEDAFWTMIVAAAAFAGSRETYLRARDYFPSERSCLLHYEVERLVANLGDMPPSLASVPADAADPELGITPADVHRQAWRDHLAVKAGRLAEASKYRFKRMA